METKTCTKCQETKTLDQFYKTTTYVWEKDGHDYYCKYCRVGTALKSQRGANKKPCTVDGCEKVHYAKGWCRNHYTRMHKNGTLHSRNEVIEGKKTYLYARGPVTYDRKYHLMWKYKLDKDTYEEMCKNGCNICGDYQERNLHVDHDHSCCNTTTTCGNCVRGVLCNKCNTLVGMYDNGTHRQDHPLINKVMEYIIKHNNKIYDKQKHNAIIADNLEEFIKKVNNG